MLQQFGEFRGGHSTGVCTPLRLQEVKVKQDNVATAGKILNVITSPLLQQVLLIPYSAPCKHAEALYNNGNATMDRSHGNVRE
jgi:hypothetical protein